MLNDATCFKQIYIVTGYTDLRFGLDSLASIIESKSGRSPYVPDTLYLFCGRKTCLLYTSIKEGDTIEVSQVGSSNRIFRTSKQYIYQGGKLVEAPDTAVDQTEGRCV